MFKPQNRRDVDVFPLLDEIYLTLTPDLNDIEEPLAVKLVVEEVLESEGPAVSFWIKGKEEPELVKRFGQEYINYREDTPFIVQRMSMKKID